MAEVQEAQGVSAIQAMLEQMQSFQQSLAQQQAAEQQAQEAQARADAEVAGTFGALIEAATIVAMADGQFSTAESRRLVARVAPLTGGRLSAEQIEALAQEAAGRIRSEGASARADAVATVLDEDLRRAALLVAGAVGWTEGGIGQKEGLALQSLSRAFGIKIEDMHKLLAQAHAGGGAA